MCLWIFWAHLNPIRVIVEKSEKMKMLPAEVSKLHNISAVMEALKIVKSQRNELSKMLNAKTQKLAHFVCQYLNASVKANMIMHLRLSEK